MTSPDSEAAKWRRIADDRLGKLAAIARIGAEPPDAVLAIISGTKPDPDAGTGGTPTIYHHSVAGFRRQLAQAAQAYRKASEEYFAGLQGKKRAEVTDTERDAYMGTLMAYGYCYTLAAVLGVAERELGPQSARRLATIADDILTNGDFDDLNADVGPGVPLPPPSSAEQAEAGQLALGHDDPVVVST